MPAPLTKTRLDQLLVERGLAETRERAQRLIRAGLVFAGAPPREQRAEKPGERFAPDIPLTLRGNDCPYVSRGGLKLAGALAAFGYHTCNNQLHPPHPPLRSSFIVPSSSLDLQHPQPESPDPGPLTLDPIRHALDIGASTGGFTDCLLQAGAAHVWAFDSGTNQLHEKIRTDPRVTWREHANARELTPAWLAPASPYPQIDLAVIDVSFISLRLILPAVATVLASTGAVIALVKPQFEAGPAEVGKGGVVRDPQVHLRVLADLAAWCAANGWSLQNISASPLRGPAGNVEFFFHLKPGFTPSAPTAPINVDNAIEQALTAAYNQ